LFQECDFNLHFIMKNNDADISCAVSTDAMALIEGSSRTAPHRREEQFMRLMPCIEARASRKFQDGEVEGKPPNVVLRALDFR
jgi:hypothetical protein